MKVNINNTLTIKTANKQPKASEATTITMPTLKKKETSDTQSDEEDFCHDVSMNSTDFKLFETIKKKKKVNKKHKNLVKRLKHFAENSFGNPAVELEMNRIVEKIISKINECSAGKYGDHYEEIVQLHLVRFFTNYEKIIIQELVSGKTKNEIICNINTHIGPDDSLEYYSPIVYKVLSDSAEFTYQLRNKLQETNHIVSASKTKEHWISRMPLHLAVFSTILALQLLTTLVELTTTNNTKWDWHKILIPGIIILAFFGSIFLVYRRVPQSICAEIFKTAEPEYNKFKEYLRTTYWPKAECQKQLAIDDYVTNLETKIFLEEGGLRNNNTNGTSEDANVDNDDDPVKMAVKSLISSSSN